LKQRKTSKNSLNFINTKETRELMKKGEKEKAEKLKNEVTDIKKEMGKIETELKEMENKLMLKALNIPNIPDDDVPIGKDENDNVEIKRVGKIPTFDFEIKSHDELGKKLNWLDFKKGVNLAKSRFTVLKKDAARIERALINFFLDHNRQWGFEEVYVPFMVNRETMTGTGQLPPIHLVLEKRRVAMDRTQKG